MNKSERVKAWKKEMVVKTIVVEIQKGEEDLAEWLDKAPHKPNSRYIKRLLKEEIKRKEAKDE